MEIVTTHKSADFDALASVIAACMLYPEAVPVMPKAMNPNVKGFLSIHKDIFDTYSPTEIDLDEVTRLIVVDTNSWRRLDGNLSKLKDKAGVEVILWDHHTPADIHADITYQEETGACITLLAKELQKRKLLLTPVQSTLFLLGLYEDTGNLSFNSTTSDDAHAAGYLLERKADLNVLSSFIQNVYGELQKQILFEMLKTETSLTINGHKISMNHVNITGHIGNLSVVVHMYREIVGADAAFGIFTDTERERVIVIGRSKTEDLNVGTIMRTLGGGGHPGAGSAMIKGANPKAVEETITNLIYGNQQSSVRLSDIMSYPVHSVLPETTMSDLSMVLVEKGCTGMPVIDASGKMVGVVSKRDFRKVKKKNQMNSPVKAFMSPSLVTISPDKSPTEAARVMVKYDIGRLPVMKEGEIIGIVSRSDVMMYFYDLLPD